MRAKFMIAAACLLSAPVASLTVAAQEQSQPSGAATVQRSVDAYRARNLDAFVRTFAPDAVVDYEGMRFQGRAQIRQAYSLNFAPGAPKLEIIASGAQGNTIWMETSYTFSDGTEMCCGYSEYTVENGQITYLSARSR